MKYALISDIHGNLPALDAVLDDITRRQPDATYHLGDLVGCAPWPNEVMSRLSECGISGVAGNYDSSKMGSGVAARPGDIIAFGHTHKPWHRVAAPGSGPMIHAV